MWGFFLPPFPRGFSATDECIFVSLSPPRETIVIFLLPCIHLPYVSSAGFSNTVSLSCQICPLKSFISLLFLNSNLFWPLFSPPVLSEHLTDTAGMGCWVISLWPLVVPLCFPNWMKVVLSLYFVRPRYYCHVRSGESTKKALHPAVVPLWFVVGIVACVHVQPFYASFLW